MVVRARHRAPGQSVAPEAGGAQWKEKPFGIRAKGSVVIKESRVRGDSHNGDPSFTRSIIPKNPVSTGSLLLDIGFENLFPLRALKGTVFMGIQ
jgi:hypothetical protein